MTANITLKREEILFDIMNRSHSECANITDVEARYRAEAGSDRKELIGRLLGEATSELKSAISRWLTDEFSRTGNDIPEDGDVTLQMELSQRRIDGKVPALKEKAHAYLVERTLFRFYATAGQPELSTAYQRRSEDSIAAIERIMFSKKQPMI